jgi:DNA-binding transcriptional regulator YdaS (Cro superfamily)
MHFLCLRLILIRAFNAAMKKELIQKLGGNKAVAEALRVDRSAVGNWLLDGRDIPWKHKPAIARLAAEKAISLPSSFWERSA